MMYMDKLDGRITQEFFDKQSATWRGEQDGLQRKIQRSRRPRRRRSIRRSTCALTSQAKNYPTARRGTAPVAAGGG